MNLVLAEEQTIFDKPPKALNPKLVSRVLAGRVDGQAFR